MTRPRQVLVIDDEPDVCWALESLLERHGYTVVTMDNGADALRWLNSARKPCDLILVDAKLTDIDGVDLARRIRTETSCRAPMIMVSGFFYRDDGIVQETLRAGFIQAFVTKPFRHDEMIDTINAVLSP